MMMVCRWCALAILAFSSIGIARSERILVVSKNFKATEIDTTSDDSYSIHKEGLDSIPPIEPYCPFEPNVKNGFQMEGFYVIVQKDKVLLFNPASGSADWLQLDYSRFNCTPSTVYLTSGLTGKNTLEAFVACAIDGPTTSLGIYKVEIDLLTNKIGNIYLYEPLSYNEESQPINPTAPAILYFNHQYHSVFAVEGNASVTTSPDLPSFPISFNCSYVAKLSIFGRKLFAECTSDSNSSTVTVVAKNDFNDIDSNPSKYKTNYELGKLLFLENANLLIALSHNDTSCKGFSKLTAISVSSPTKNESYCFPSTIHSYDYGTYDGTPVFVYALVGEMIYWINMTLNVAFQPNLAPGSETVLACTDPGCAGIVYQTDGSVVAVGRNSNTTIIQYSLEEENDPVMWEIPFAASRLEVVNNRANPTSPSVPFPETDNTPIIVGVIISFVLIALVAIIVAAVVWKIWRQRKAKQNNIIPVEDGGADDKADPVIPQLPNPLFSKEVKLDLEEEVQMAEAPKAPSKEESEPRLQLSESTQSVPETVDPRNEILTDPLQPETESVVKKSKLVVDRHSMITEERPVTEERPPTQGGD